MPALTSTVGTKRNYTGSAEQTSGGAAAADQQLSAAEINAGLVAPINDHAALIDAAAPTEQAFTTTAIWTFVHNRNGYPAIVCVDEAGRAMSGGNPDYTSRNSVTVQFNSPVSGTMRLI